MSFTLGVYGFRHQLFTGARFPENESVGIGIAEKRNLLLKLKHLRVYGDYIIKTVERFDDILVGGKILEEEKLHEKYP